ncbi:ergothioneine biosynthesis glutamate--cysteine ligase EgtA [Streptomyces sp. NRRL F-5122]|uniref:ergothioneine biosynthesis glutamate--cysteine ligase EgtA n=1 Tax=Streptomyces sp. NRRL F-5122 TaxID=1609098 RepID=UPI00099EDE30|nr:ergothioneine biosynthesis glutamate--cysteine ligase EgtA [Streptomyces sp. NRRL F-5122]
MSELDEERAEQHVQNACFKKGPPRLVGVESEWLVQDHRDAGAPISPHRLNAAVSAVEIPGALPQGSKFTREPGGQVELSSLPAPSLARCIEAMAADLATLRQAAESAGLVLTGRGLDPIREPARVLQHPRYQAMESFFDREGPWGRIMMRCTASVQINLDCGEDTGEVSGYRHRWELAHRIGPVLVAAFANSPLRNGRPTGWLSTRQAVWAHMDPKRTRQPRYHTDPGTAWMRYALEADVMCIPGDDHESWLAPPDLSFRDWLRGVSGLRPPTVSDLDYHLSTLFPPVRPRGWLELRMTDAQDGDNWIVPVVLAATLLNNPHAADAAWAATDPLCRDVHPFPSDDVWERAARIGLADPELAKAARACFAAADNALADPGVPVVLRQALAHFAERYSERGRSPAHDELDALQHV